MGKRKDVQADAQADAAPEAAKDSTPAEASSPSETANSDTPPVEAITAAPVAEVKAEPAAPTAESELPVVDAPKIDGSTSAASPEAAETPASAEAETVPESSAAAVSKSGAASRFALLAASIAIAAAIGSFVGSLGARLLIGSTTPVIASADRGSAQIAAEINALKANVDTASRNTTSQIAKIADRIERAERAQADPAAKIARIADTVDRLEKRSAAAAAAPETTGSIIAAPPAQGALADPKSNDRVLDGWVVHRVVDGHALVESRYGNLFEISAGGFLPGVGRVQQIKRQDGRWLIVTARGVIESYH